MNAVQWVSGAFSPYRRPGLPFVVAVLLFGLAWAAGSWAQEGDAIGQSPLTVSIDDLSVSVEGQAGTSIAQVPVRLSRIPGRPGQIGYATVDGSARGGGACGPGVDFLAQPSGTLLYGPRDTGAAIAVTICGDTVSEGPQAFTVQLTSGGEAGITDGSATVTIQDDDPVPALSVSARPVAEGDAGTTGLAFQARLAAAAERPTRIEIGPVTLIATGEIAATGGTACGGEVDYLRPPATIDVEPGVTQKTIDVKVCGDTALEPNEKVGFTASLVPASGPYGGFLSPGVAGGALILNDDSPRLTVETTSVREGSGGGASSAALVVRLSHPTTREVSFSFATRDGTAVGGATCPAATSPLGPAADLVHVEGRVAIRPGETAATLQVPICGDRLAEPNETFALTLANAANASLPAGATSVTIQNDD